MRATHNKAYKFSSAANLSLVTQLKHALKLNAECINAEAAKMCISFFYAVLRSKALANNRKQGSGEQSKNG